MRFANATKLYRKSGVAQWRDLRFHFRQKRMCRGRIASRFRFSIKVNRRSLRCVTPDFLSRFREAYVAEVIDFVDTILSDRAPRVTGEDGLRAVEIAVAAEKSVRTAAPCKVGKGD